MNRQYRYRRNQENQSQIDTDKNQAGSRSIDFCLKLIICDTINCHALYSCLPIEAQGFVIFKQFGERRLLFRSFSIISGAEKIDPQVFGRVTKIGKAVRDDQIKVADAAACHDILHNRSIIFNPIGHSGKLHGSHIVDIIRQDAVIVVVGHHQDFLIF